MDESEVAGLLREIRDAQRATQEALQRLVERAEEGRRQALERQERITAAARRVAYGGGVLVTALLAILVFLLARWWRILFR